MSYIYFVDIGYDITRKLPFQSIFICYLLLKLLKEQWNWMIASKHNQDISSYNLWLAIYKHSFLACFHLKLKNIFNKLCYVIPKFWRYLSEIKWPRKLSQKWSCYWIFQKRHTSIFPIMLYNKSTSHPPSSPSSRHYNLIY